MGLETYKGIIFDSKEEVWFAMWLEELKQHGFVYCWNKVIEPIELIQPYKIEYIKKTQLKTKTKEEEKEFTLLHGLEYTPDFQIYFTKQGWSMFVSPMNENVKQDRWFFSKHPSDFVYVEVKPSFDMHGKTSRFSIIQKIVLHIKNIFVDLIIPEDLFEGTFMPLEAMDDFRYKKAPRKGQWKTKYIPKTLKQFLNEK